MRSSTLNLRPATRKALGLRRPSRAQHDRSDGRRSGACRTRSKRPPRRTRSSRRPASSSVRCRASWSPSRISTTRSTCARPTAPMSPTPTIVRRSIHGRGAPAQGRRDHPGQGESWAASNSRSAVRRHGVQPVRHGAHAARLELRLGGRRGGESGDLRHWRGNRHVDPHSFLVEQRRRAVADAWS